MRVSGGWFLGGISAIFVVALVAVLAMTERGDSGTPLAALPAAAATKALPQVTSQPLVFDQYAGKPRHDDTDSGTAAATRTRRATKVAAAPSPQATQAPTPVTSAASPAAAAAAPVTSASTVTAVPVRSTVQALPLVLPKKSAGTARRKIRPSFKRGVLRTPDITIRITSFKVIAAGQEGNEYGGKPVIAFEYRTTNVSGRKTSPAVAFISSFAAYQDNNPDAENELDVGSLPDARFRESQTENIKKGRTVTNAMAYELDDLTTPVVLVATKGLDESIGKTTYRLK